MLQNNLTRYAWHTVGRVGVQTNSLCLLKLLPEMQFLKDCCCIVKPVATAIDILQGVKNCDLGCVMPTIKSLMTNVENVPTSVAVPLNNAILHGFHERLDQYFMHTDFILAANLSSQVKAVLG